MSRSPVWVRFAVFVLCTIGTGLETYLWSRLKPILYQLGDALQSVRLTAVPWREDLAFASTAVSLTALTALDLGFILLGKTSAKTLLDDLMR